VPTVLLKDATRPRASEASGSKPPDTPADAAAAAAEAEPAAAATAATAVAAAEGENSTAGDAPMDVDAASQTAAAAAAAEMAGDAAVSPTAAAADAAAAGSSGSSEVQGVELILARLPTAVSRDLCDEMAVNFCYSNSKGARKRLVRALLEVPRGNLQLLPYYARVAATISQAYPEVGAGGHSWWRRGGAQSDSQGPLVSAQLSEHEHKWPMGGGDSSACPAHITAGRGVVQ
jgi:regulator of nonsense transcripts 2